MYGPPFNRRPKKAEAKKLDKMNVAPHTGNKLSYIWDKQSKQFITFGPENDAAAESTPEAYHWNGMRWIPVEPNETAKGASRSKSVSNGRNKSAIRSPKKQTNSVAMQPHKVAAKKSKSLSSQLVWSNVPSPPPPPPPMNPTYGFNQMQGNCLPMNNNNYPMYMQNAPYYWW